MQKIELENINNSTVLVRVGFDIPNYEKLDRIESAKKTINFLLSNDNKVVLVTKWGRPEGNFDPDLTTKKLVDLVKKTIGITPAYINQFDDDFSLLLVEDCNENLILLENVYFSEDENNVNASTHSVFYSEMADYFVDECFISSHRKDATNHYIKNYLPYAYGFSYNQEIENLNSLKENPDRPFYVVIGGAKLKTKLPFVEKMLEISDGVLLCGLLCFTFVEASNRLGLTDIDIKDSYVENGFVHKAMDLLEKFEHKIFLPEDFVFDRSMDKEKGVDIGPLSVSKFNEKISVAKTLFWNGPAGFVEKKPYDQGSLEIARSIIKNDNCHNVVGGGDTVGFLSEEFKNKFDYISYAGGATLNYLSI